MTERKIIKAKGTKKQQDKQGIEIPPVSLDSQARLAEILNDSPRLVSLNGTEWEIRALRMGTQFLIAQKCIEVAKLENANFGDIVKQFSVNIPAVIDVLALALLNDKQRIYKNGNEKSGFSDEFYLTRNTLMWDCNTNELGPIFLETLQLLDVSFFLEANRMLEIFREGTMARKNQTLAQK